MNAVSPPPSLEPAAWDRHHAGVEPKTAEAIGAALKQLAKLRAAVDVSLFTPAAPASVEAAEERLAALDAALRKPVRAVVDQAGRVEALAKKAQLALKADKAAPKATLAALAQLVADAAAYPAALASAADAAQTATARQLAALRAQAPAARDGRHESEAVDPADLKLVRGKLLAAMRAVKVAKPGAKPMHFVIGVGPKHVAAYVAPSVGTSHRALLKRLMPGETSVKFFTGECVWEEKAWTFVGASLPTGAFAKKLQAALLELTGTRYRLRVRRLDGETDAVEGDDEIPPIDAAAPGAAASASQAAPRPRVDPKLAAGRDEIAKRIKVLAPKAEAAGRATPALLGALRRGLHDAGQLARTSKGLPLARRRLDEVDALIREAQQLASRHEPSLHEIAAHDPHARVYTIEVGGRVLKDVSEARARDELRLVHRQMLMLVEGDYAGHEHLVKLRLEQPGVAWFTEGVSKVFLGGEEMPDLNLWNTPRHLLEQARAEIDKGGAIPGCIGKLVVAQHACKDAHERFRRFQHDSDRATDVSIEGLKLTRDVAAATAVAASGGLGGGVGAAVATAGAIGTANELASQLSAVHIAQTQKKISWSAVAKEGAAAAASELTGHLAKGFLAEQFGKVFGAYVSKVKMSDAELAIMGKALGLPGPMPRDFFMTGGQKFVRDFLTNNATKKLQKLVEGVIKGAEDDKKDLTLVNFLAGVGQEAAKDKLPELFVELVKKSLAAKAHA